MILLIPYPLEIKNKLSFDSLQGCGAEKAYDEVPGEDGSDAGFPEDLDDLIDNEEMDYFFEHMDEFCKLEEALDDLNSWMRDRGFEYGRRAYPVNDEKGRFAASLDLAWPFGVYGLQRGFTRPVAVNIFDKSPETVKMADEYGFTVFTDIDEFKAFIEKNYRGR